MKKLLPSLLIIAALAGLWTYGFLGFVKDVAALREPVAQSGLESADAIVVLTGGSERVSTGIALLESGSGKKLFISGVNKKLSLESVFGKQPVPASLRACCIALGYQADSTFGNAVETRDWLKAQGYASLRLVTANYHMPRSLRLFRAAMPDVTIIPHPVTPDSVKTNEWWRYPRTALLLATEYCKFLLAGFKIKMDEL
ncbi:MAG: YdcF family protein [Alphaproteobacteria bacterium]|nr:YdcF family protein [Alphaproteobacteria bacterium]